MVAAQDKLTTEQLSKLLETKELAVNHGPTFGKRHIQALCSFMLIFMNYFIRNSFSVIIVAMTDPNSNSNKDILTYNWTDKNVVIASFMWGYMVPQIGAGYLATMYGAKWLLTVSLLASSFLGFSVPLVAAHLGSKGVMAIRVFQGLSQGFMFPSVHAFLGKWVPVNERSRLGSLAYLGAPAGIIAAMVLSGYIAASPLGWPKALYIFSSMGIFVALLFAYFVSNQPDTHPTITEEEKFYIINNSSSTTSNQETKNIPVPWREILTSVKFWAMIIAQTGFSYGSWTLMLETPIYMNHVMKFDLKSNSVLSSLPYIADVLCTFFFSGTADYLIIKKILPLGTTRKIMNAICMLGSAIPLILLAFCGSNDSQKAVILLVVIGGVTGASKSGFNVNQIDLSPNYSGILMGISNCISVAVCSLGPLVVHILVKDENDPLQWRIIFYIAAIFAVVSFIFNVIFGSGSVQPWNNGSRKMREKHETLSLKA